jgi:hypothetical protein
MSKNRAIYDPAISTPGHRANSIKISIQYRYLHTRVHCSNRGMEKENLVYEFNRILLSHRQEILSIAVKWAELEVC